MTTTDLINFLHAAQATLHVSPEGVIIIQTTKSRLVTTNNHNGELERAVNEHARKVFA